MSRFELGVAGLTTLVLILSGAPAHACPLHRADLDGLATGPWIPGIELGATWEYDRAVREGHGSGGSVGVLSAGMISQPVDRPAREVGRWLAPRSWPVIGIHAAVLPTGEVLHYAYPGAARLSPLAPGSPATLWDPVDGSFVQTSWRTDVFCSGHSFLPDGRLYLAGGNAPTGDCDTRGRNTTHVFDPETARWTELERMVRARWYPSQVTRADGSVWIFGGLDELCNHNTRVERFTPEGGLELLPGSEFVQLYPRLHPLSDGRIGYVGPQRFASIYDPATASWEPRVADMLLPRGRFEGTGFAVPGQPDRAMICGGFGDYDQFPTNTCESIDLLAPRPRFEARAPMHFARAHGDGVVLPDGRVLVVGGGHSGLYGNPVLNAEVYDPATDRWTLLPPQVYGRMYHATAVLLPDGRVLSAGQDDDEDDGLVSGHWAEIYEPDYLFRGLRPEILQAPAAVAWDGAFPLTAAGERPVRRVTLVRLSAVTHSTNTTQRFAELAVEPVAGDRLRVTAPANPHVYPPGYYMLFALDEEGVPSESRMLRLAPAEELAGFVELGADRITVVEDEGVVSIPLVRTGGTAGAVTARLEVAGGTAVDGVDFDAESLRPLTWDDGAAGERTVTLRLSADAEIEDDETVELTLGALTGGLEPGARTTLQVVIVNDDSGSTGRVELASTVFEAREDAGSATVEVHRLEGSRGPARVRWHTEDLSAEAAVDYVGSQGVVTWEANDGEPRTFSIGLLDDARAEGTEMVRLVLSDAEGAELGERVTAVLRLDDDDRAPGCAAGGQTLCLRDGRFRVEVEWRDLESRSGDRGIGGAVPGTAESGFFWFFDAANLELVVKILDARSLDGHHWLFYGALSDVEYWITVTDTVEGEVRTYHSPPRELCGRADTRAFPGSGGAPPAPLAVPLPAPREEAGVAAGACTPGPETLCLLDGRLRLEVTWRDPRSGDQGRGGVLAGAARPDAADTGMFWFFDPANVELVAKALDAGPVNGHLWVFYGALTDVAYTLTVTDTTTGAVRHYDNPAGNLCGRGDTAAFPTTQR